MTADKGAAGGRERLWAEYVASGEDGRHGVVGLSGSAASWRALAFGCGWAQRTASRLTIVHVLRSPSLAALDAYAAAAASRVADDLGRQLDRDVAHWMRDQPIAWSLVTLSGSPAQMLQLSAQRRDADAVFLGRSAPRPFRRSVDEYLRRRTTRIVVAVP